MTTTQEILAANSALAEEVAHALTRGGANFTRVRADQGAPAYTLPSGLVLDPIAPEHRVYVYAANVDDLAACDTALNLNGYHSIVRTDSFLRTQFLEVRKFANE